MTTRAPAVLKIWWNIHTSFCIVSKILLFKILRILLKQNTALLSIFSLSQAWHLNFSQLFDDLGHENHIFSESILSTLTTLFTWPPDHLTTWTTLTSLITGAHLDHLTFWPNWTERLATNKKFNSESLFLWVLGIQTSWILLNMVNHSLVSHFQKELEP